jgi:wyosine [tRNA(Phe)-imidazoG37] synthetase (radical SAM superfamily)
MGALGPARSQQKSDRHSSRKILLAADGNVCQVKHSCRCWVATSPDVVSGSPTGEPALKKTKWEEIGHVHKTVDLTRIVQMARNRLLIMLVQGDGAGLK